MPAFDFSILYRDEIAPEDLKRADWDVFISAYNLADRTHAVFENANAVEKYWLVHKEYGIEKGEMPIDGISFDSLEDEEDAFVGEFMGILLKKYPDLTAIKICIDITGFMRPHLMFLVLALYRLGVRKFHAIYSEPQQYSQKEKTVFSKGDILDVRPVNGMSTRTNPDNSRDLLVIGCGYDDKLIAEVAEHKDSAAKVQIYGFPPLRADMYQQNVYRASRALEAIGERNLTRDKILFAPANDPFVTANVIAGCVARHETDAPISNLYLSPLATKAQALGFALYYVLEGDCRAMSMLFPFSASYSKETSGGISRIWIYTVQLP